MTRWVNAAAIEWVLYEASQDIPAALLAPLIAVASFAGSDGTGAHPSTALLAMMTRKSERQVKRDLDALEQLGLIELGDQGRVAHIRADRRPNVYDLPAAAREHVVGSPKRGVIHVTPNGVSPMSPRDGNGVTSRAARGVTGVRNGVSPMSPEEFNEKTLKNAPRDDMRERLALIGRHGAYPERAATIGEHQIRIQAYGQMRAEGLWTAADRDTAIDHEKKLWKRGARG